MQMFSLPMFARLRASHFRELGFPLVKLVRLANKDSSIRRVDERRRGKILFVICAATAIFIAAATALSGVTRRVARVTLQN